MTTDIHAHIVPEEFIAVLASEVPVACPTLSSRADGWYFEYPGGRVSGPVPPGMFDVGARLDDMDKTEVDVQALSVPPPHFQYRLEPAAAATHARLYNDSIVTIDPDPVGSVRAAVDDPGTLEKVLDTTPAALLTRSAVRFAT